MKKTALLFSAADYQPSNSLKLSDLSCCKFDIPAMQTRLDQIGFEVHIQENAQKADFIPTIQSVTVHSPPDAINIVYFTGHGGHYNGDNYIFPSDAGARYDVSHDMADAAINIKDIISVFKGKGRLILILDACRSHIGAAKGYFSEMASSENVYIAYATMFEQISHGPQTSISWFTEAICDEILMPNIDVDTLFTKVRQNILTKHSVQIPASVNALLDKVVLHSTANTSPEDKQVYDFVKKHSEAYDKKFGYFHADDLIFVDAAQYFNIGLLDAIWKYHIVDNEIYKAAGGNPPEVSEAEYKTITLATLTKGTHYFTCDENYTWYYNGRQIRMGEIPPLPPSMQQAMPEPGKEIEVKLTAEKENDIITITTTLPNNCEVFIRQNPEKFARQHIVSEGKIVIDNAASITGITINNAVVFPKDEIAKQLLGHKCRNLVGEHIKFHPIHGNTISWQHSF